MCRNLALSLMMVMALSAGVAEAVIIDTVPIGNAGNPPDTTGFGSVPYTYRISRFEITNAEYAELLNAVAATDTHELYHSKMGTDWRSGIERSGTSGSYSYTVKPDMGDKPVNYITFWDAARFANWLHNGQPTGAQDNGTTEDGAYTLGGVTFPPNESVSRNAGARWFLPSEDEWYKAAYYDLRSQEQGGPPSDDNYWRFATQSDVDPVIAAANNIGDISNPGPNVANYDLGADWNGTNGNVTTVGSAGPESASSYGTFDQAGNVWEWNEAIVIDLNRSEESTFRGMRGASWDDGASLVASSLRGYGGIELCGTVWQCTNANTGIRVASIFLPNDLNGDSSTDALDIDLLTSKINAVTTNTAFDLNEDGYVDQRDRRVWVKQLANTYFGDANLDGMFDSRDLVEVFVAGKYETVLKAGWAQGDWDGDGLFGSSDLVVSFQDDGYERGLRAAVTAVPEPGSGILLAAVLVPVVATLRRRPQNPS